MDQSELNELKSKLRELQTKTFRVVVGWAIILMCIVAITDYTGYDDHIMLPALVISAIIPLIKSCQYACEYDKLSNMLDNETLTQSQINEKKLRRMCSSIRLTFHTLAMRAFCIVGIPFIILMDIATLTDIQFKFVVAVYILCWINIVIGGRELIKRQYPEYKRACAEVGLKPLKFVKIVSYCLFAYLISGIWLLIGFIVGLF